MQLLRGMTQNKLFRQIKEIFFLISFAKLMCYVLQKNLQIEKN